MFEICLSCAAAEMLSIAISEVLGIALGHCVIASIGKLFQLEFSQSSFS